MIKNNLEITRNETENPKVIRVCENYEMDRYTPSIVCADWECEFALNDLHEDCLIWTPCRDYQTLKNFDLDEDELTGDLQEDLALFQSKIGDDYEAYVLGAYIHSGTSFSVSKSGDHRCAFDSGQLGFLGIKKSSSMTPETVAKSLTSIWNGEFYEYQVYDELREEMYGVNFDDVKVEY